MRLTIRAFGLDLLDVELSSGEAEEVDLARDLSGGYLSSTLVDDGPTDRYMGFTNGREDES